MIVIIVIVIIYIDNDNNFLIDVSNDIKVIEE